LAPNQRSAQRPEAAWRSAIVSARLTWPSSVQSSAATLSRHANRALASA
jgi:hypothetical protein